MVNKSIVRLNKQYTQSTFIPDFILLNFNFNQMQSQEPNHQQSEEHHQSGPLVILFVFFGLLCGCLLRQINKKTKIPYTPMLLILGIFFGYFQEHLGAIGDSVQLIENISPHMILLIFIPILIFQSAFNCDWYVFRKSLVNILLLAGPGVLWGAVIIAFMFKVLLGYDDTDLTWYEALALGSVLSATDPVAVVALLKQLGASVKFNTLVQGESLLNDGTAMVFFLLFMSLVKGQSTSALIVFTKFLRTSIGGPILGIIFGFFMSWWMKKIIRDSVLSVMVTFVGAFLCFYVAEFTWLKVSGILSIVCLGLYFSAVGKRKIYPQSQQALHNVWAAIQYSSETLIFVLTGIVVGVKMIHQTTITSMDWIKMFIFWILMIIARAIMVLTFYPFIIKSGYGLNIKQFIVLIYGGLRGALGMCLALFVCVDPALSIRFRELTVFYMCGMAMMTIVINGLTCNKLVNYLEMIKVPQIKQKLLQRCIRKVLQTTQQKLKQIKNESNISYSKWKEVQRIANVKSLGSTFHETRNSRKTTEFRDSFKQFDKKDIFEELRFKFTRFLSKIYWQFYQEGELAQQSIQILISSCNITNDESNLKLRYFDILTGFFALDSIQYLMKFRNIPFFGKFFVRSTVHKIYLAYEVSTVFIEASEQVLHQFTQTKYLHAQHVRYIVDEVKENIENSISFISQLQNNYPQIIQAVHTQRAVTILLKCKKNRLKQMYEEGYVDEKDYSILRQQIDLALVSTRSTNYKLEEIKFSQVISQCPLLSSLTAKQMIDLRMKAKQKLYEKNTVILTKGKLQNYVTIIITGSVREQFDNFYFMRSIGNIVNPYDYTYRTQSKCQAKARNDIKVLQIEENVISELLQNNKEFKKKWYKSLFIYCLKHHKGEEQFAKQLSDKQMRRLIEFAEVVILNKQTQFEIASSAFVFEGQIQSQNSVYVAGSYISKGKLIKVLTNSIILNFKFIPGLKIQEERMSILNEKLD